MFLTPNQLREHEAEWFSNGGDVAAALEEAGAGIARAIAARFPQPGTLWLFLGIGHNAGDAIVAAQHLQTKGWTIRYHLAIPESAPARQAHFSRWTGRAHLPSGGLRMAPLTAEHFDVLAPLSASFVPETPERSLPRPWVTVDGLCGIGARLPLTGSLAKSVHHINEWRDQHGAYAVAIDLPSGLDGSTGQASDPCVTADMTITLAAVKPGLVLSTQHVGRLVLIPLATLPMPDNPPGGAPSSELLLTSETVARWLPPRAHDIHKGHAGRLALVAGAPGMSGAAVLAAHGALHAGGGLVTVFCPESVLAEVSARCPAEAMVRPLPANGLLGIPVEEFSVIALGPGCGRTLDADLDEFTRSCPRPLVLDADALTGLAAGHTAHTLPLANPIAPRIVTPHPGEFTRLAPDLAKLPRHEAAAAFAKRYPGTTLLLKGFRTIVARSDRPLAYNQTGHNGLAAGGSGDILTGITTALFARQTDSWKVASTAAWLHGRAAELAQIYGNESPESLVATTTTRWLGAAFRSLANRED